MATLAKFGEVEGLSTHMFFAPRDRAGLWVMSRIQCEAARFL